jgi:pimeloyl-ACP methyl ester carboxylesterase
MRVVFVHGACVRDGEWWWHRTAEQLRARGVLSSAAKLPSCGESTAEPVGWHGPGFDEDVAALQRLLDGVSEPTVVVAHSYGGIVTAQAAVGRSAVRQLLLISSYLPEPGESLSSFGGQEPAEFLDVDADAGTFSVRPQALADTFLADCSPEIIAEASNHLAWQSLSVTQHPVTASAWPNVPSTYLLCTQDKGTPVAAQREFAQRATRVVEIDASHHPFLSQPETVAGVILGLSDLPI